MPKLRTDDGPKRLRAVWLGPKGNTLPFEWTYVQWCVTLALLPVGLFAGSYLLAGIAVLLTGSPAWWFTGVIGPLIGGYGAVMLAVRIMRNVTFDEPVRYKIAVLRAELGRSRRRLGSATEWVLDWPTIND